jgi:hypothetical protein
MLENAGILTTKANKVHKGNIKRRSFFAFAVFYNSNILDVTVYLGTVSKAGQNGGTG